MAFAKWTETAADLAIGGPLLVLDRLGDVARRVVGRSEERAQEFVRTSRRHAREVARDARESASDAIHEARVRVSEPDTRPYEERTLDELYELAQERDLDGRSQMNKAQLIVALREGR